MPLRGPDLDFSELAVLCFCSQPTGGLDIVFSGLEVLCFYRLPTGALNELRNKPLQPSAHRHMIQILTRKRMHRQ